MKGTYYPDLKLVKDRISSLENTLLKIAYYAEITEISGQISIPENATVLLDQWDNGVDALVCKINQNKPDFQDTGIDVTSFDISGNYILSGTLPSTPSALIYYITIPLKYLSTLDIDYIIDYVELKAHLSDIIDYINFNNNIVNPTYLEGRVFYDRTKKALSYYNENQDITVNLGQEFLIRVYNDTGAPILNGSIVYPTGTNIIENLITVGLAIANRKDKCRLVAMVTADIPIGGVGYVTRLGEVGGINTGGMTGVVYLSATIPGAFTMTKPVNDAFVIAIGAVKISHISNGSIVLDPNISELTVEATDTNGFSSQQRANTLLSFNDSTRYFTISATSFPFCFYVNGDKFEKTTLETIQIPDEEGLYAFYYDSAILKVLKNPTTTNIDTVIRSMAIIAYVYWDAVNKVSTYFADERHGIGMTPTTHAYLHFVKGAQYLYGLGLTNVSVDQNGTSNSHAQFGISEGAIIDEDIMTIAPAILSTVGLPIYYILGSTTKVLRRILNPGYSVVTDVVAGVGITGRLVYNQNNAGTYQLTVASTGYFIVCHVVCLNGYSGKDKQIAIIGQNQYLNINSARQGVSTEIASLTTNFPLQEVVFIASLIFETKDGFSNAVKAVIRSVASGVSYVDYISKTGVEGTTGLFDTSDGKTVYVQNGVIKRIV